MKFYKEEVYVEQHKCFTNHLFLNHVYKLKIALYGPKQVPFCKEKRLKPDTEGHDGPFCKSI